jgi:small subunit ribosomal protein S1
MFGKGGIAMLPYRPEGLNDPSPGIDKLQRSIGTGDIFEAICVKCDEHHNLHVDLDTVSGIIPRQEAALGLAEGKTKEYAILSRVGKPVCFQVMDLTSDGTAILSRRAAQMEAKDFFLSTLQSGDIIEAVVQNPADFGVFCDIGCGFPALMRIDRCCISRLQRTSDLYHIGQQLHLAVLDIDDSLGQILLTGREMLGTWEENAALFTQGQTVPGIVRSTMPYGLFVELTPNLSGLAEPAEGICPGDAVSVYIRSIIPSRHKIKLNIIEKIPTVPVQPIPRFIHQNKIKKWEYYPGSKAFTVF